MRYVVLDNNDIVVNAIVVDAEIPYSDPEGRRIVRDDAHDIGENINAVKI